MPRWLLVSLTISWLAPASSAIAQQGGFPPALIGLWAESPITCDLLKRLPANAPSDRSWVRITPETVSGTTSGRFMRALGPKAARTTDDKLSTITVDFELRKGGILFETVTGARASMQYMRCR
ncbi:hypothetical protein [Methylorubrum extorquens]